MCVYAYVYGEGIVWLCNRWNRSGGGSNLLRKNTFSSLARLLLLCYQVPVPLDALTLNPKP